MPASTPPTNRHRFRRRLLLKLFLTRELVTLLSLPMALYIDALLLDLDHTDQWGTVALSLALTYLCSGVLLSLLVMRRLLHGALRTVPHEAPEQRLERLLALPWKLILLGNLLMWMVGGFLINTNIALLLDRKDVWSIVPQGMAVATGVGLLNGTLLFIIYERMLMPLTFKAFKRSRRSLPARGSLFRPRQSWFLPYVLASLLFGTLVFTGTVVKVQLARKASPDEFLLSVGGTTALLLLGSALTVWAMGRRQRAGAEAIYTALEGLTRGTLRTPRWISTDEMGDLASGVCLLFNQLQKLPRELQAVTLRLGEASASLAESSHQQEQTLRQQSAALLETETTARKLHHNSVLTRKQVQSIHSAVDRTAKLGEQGKLAIESSVRLLSEIRDKTRHVRDHVSQLGGDTQKLQRVIKTVEDLAKRTNVLAINAAIQAVHSGERGLGFNTVAAEFRKVADKSNEATEEVRIHIQSLNTAIHGAISLVENGTDAVDEAVKKLNTESGTLNELTQQTRDNSVTMKELAQAAGQQDQDIHQLLGAFEDIRRGMENTLSQLPVVQRAAEDCKKVPGEVDALARKYGLGKAPLR